jgi:putative membrane protein
VTNRVLLTLFIAVFVWSLIHPHDYFTWFLEVFPAIIGIVLIVALRKSFPLTPLLLTLLTLHAIILMAGGHYTYAEVPLGFWMRDVFHLGRNDYDRIGHFAQGFVPAIAAREILIRRNVVRGRGWLYFIIVAICLAISAAYELLEWRVSVATGSSGDAFLGTQGDVWDTQEDMATALIGALVAPLLLGRLHDRQISQLEAGSASRESR